MKTIKEWFEELPEPYRGQAIKRTSATMLESLQPSIRHALSRAFYWEYTPEGLAYWSKLSRSYCVGKEV